MCFKSSFSIPTPLSARDVYKRQEYFYTANLNDVVGYLPLGSYPVTQITKEKYNG